MKKTYITPETEAIAMTNSAVIAVSSFTLGVSDDQASKMDAPARFDRFDELFED